MTVDFDAEIRQQSALFRRALTGADPAARVPTCPDWSAKDLLGHLAGVHWWWSTIIENRVTDPDDVVEDDRNEPGDHPALLRYFDEQTQRLSELLDAAPDDTEVWTWSRNHSVGFIRRRMAHEALIHRIDAELTAGLTVSHVDAELAADGIAEMIDYFFGGPAWSAFTASGPVGLLRATDTGGQWSVQVGSVSGTSPDGERSYDQEPAFRAADASAQAPSFTVSAAARDLDAWLWQRPTHTDVAVEGSDADFAAFTAIVTA